MIVKFGRLGCVYAGRSIRWDMRCEIALAFWQRRNAPEHEIWWHLVVAVAWNWPTIIYRYVAPPPHVAGSSAAWTGREIGYAALIWPRLSRPRMYLNVHSVHSTASGRTT